MKTKNELPELENRQETGQKDVFSLKEAANYMGLAVGTLYRLTSRRALAFYKPGGKVIYLKLSDIQAYMLRNRIASRDEIESEAANYMVTDNHSKHGGK
jgi:excisionase family DNA binding protein